MTERKRFILSILFPVLFIITIWTVKAAEIALDTDFGKYGIYPLRFSNLSGIILSPFIHADFRHLYSNTFPFLFLASGLFYFYRGIAFKVFLSILIAGGLAVWLTARPAYHIGASGIIYGLASFLLFSGFIHKNRALIAVSFIVIFLYGSIIWGVLPTDKAISWESHLSGFIVGILASIWFSKNLPYTSSAEVSTEIPEDFTEISHTSADYDIIEYEFNDEDNEENIN